MANITIRNLDDAVKERLRVRAAMQGRSMEEEARLILRNAVDGMSGRRFWEKSRALFSKDNGVELDLPTRDQDRPTPNFAE